ncbi:hypothetical protein [Larsenimonas rhizosphaerae]|uniref:Uncharacterized protein n=1 Tax=Larsenimonas rhizosphaerae TaxID=2944682 RepID=A0AA41ZFR9_9GAMM|nr:hypothetical protein [Larsenimonas rhizosphaerae]MCX2524439.1 hypothetical protein [Larsenimonas rhizosphaerae]
MFTESQKIETYKMLGQVAMCSGGSEYKIAWAMSLLEQGVASPNLDILATLSKPVNEFEADDYFNRVLTELGILWPGDEAAIEGYAKVISLEVIEGQISPESGASRMYALYAPLNYPDPLHEFSSLDDEWYCECINGWSEQQRRDEIVRACKEAYEAFCFPCVFKT